MPLPNRASACRARRAVLLLVAAASGVGLLTSCSGESNAAAEGATVLDVSLGRFVIEPGTLEAPAGHLVLRITNDDPEMVHDFVAYGKGTRRLAPGESQTLDIPDVAPGTYRMWCDVPGHAGMGQVGSLVVTASSAPTSATP